MKIVLTHFIKFYTLEGNIPSPTINIFGKFPPNTFIPHPTFILLRVNVHPIWLFHTLPLLGTQEYLGESGIRGGCCNPSYWEDRIGGWPLCRRSAKGSKWLAEGPHYTSILVGGRCGPRPPRGQTQFESCRGPRSCRTSSPKTGSPLWVRFPAAAVLGLTTGVGK